MEVRDDGRLNPYVILSQEDVLAWLRDRVDAAGYADRTLLGCQITVENPFNGGTSFHHEVPKLVLMVSNIKGSHRPSGQDASAPK